MGEVLLISDYDSDHNDLLISFLNACILKQEEGFSFIVSTSFEENRWYSNITEHC